MPRRSLDPKDYSPAGGVWTYEEYMKLPVENTRYEVIAGELYITPTPPTLHQAIAGPFLAALYQQVEEDHQLGFIVPGPIDVLFGEGDFIEPDAVFVRRDRQEILIDQGLEGVPDLIVEFVAPDTAERDRGLKRERYAHFGVPEYWVVDGEARTVEIYRLDRPMPELPEVVTGSWSWQPMPNGPVVEMNLPKLLEKLDELKRMFERNKRRSADAQPSVAGD
jgi:Uma2 family endonuclease